MNKIQGRVTVTKLTGIPLILGLANTNNIRRANNACSFVNVCVCVFNVYVAFVCARYDTANRTAGGDVQLSGALAKIGLCRAIVYRSKTLRDKTAVNRG